MGKRKTLEDIKVLQVTVQNDKIRWKMSTLIDEVFFECKCNLGLDIGNANLSVLEIFYCGQLIKHMQKTFISDQYITTFLRFSWVTNYHLSLPLGMHYFFLLSIAVYHASFDLDFTIREYICLLQIMVASGKTSGTMVISKFLLAFL